MDIIKKSQYKKTAIGLLPIDWKVLKAGDIFSNHTNKKHDGNLEVLSATQDRGIIPRNKLDIEIKYDKNSLKNYKKVEPGDFVISLRSFQGGIEYSDYEGIVSPAYTVLKNKIEIDEGFYKYLFKKEDFINRLNSVIYGIRDGKQISYSDFKDLKLQYPPIGEQKRIATILSTWDKAIDLKEKLIEHKKEQKKGLMQKLLTGEVRLPGFDKEWKTFKIGDLLKERSETGYNDLELLAITSSKGVVRRTEIDIKDNSSEDKSKYKRILPNDIGYNTMRMWQGVSGVSKYEGIVSPAYTILKPTNKVNSEFIGYLFKLPKIVNVFRRFSQGLVNDTLNLKYENLKKINITIPQDINEQVRIAEVLSCIDKEIDILQKDVEVLRQQKKGLMQLLLTGKVRVQV